jgi:hypothetical protein
MRRRARRARFNNDGDNNDDEFVPKKNEMEGTDSNVQQAELVFMTKNIRDFTLKAKPKKGIKNYAKIMRHLT